MQTSRNNMKTVKLVSESPGYYRLGLVAEYFLLELETKCNGIG